MGTHKETCTPHPKRNPAPKITSFDLLIKEQNATLERDVGTHLQGKPLGVSGIAQASFFPRQDGDAPSTIACTEIEPLHSGPETL